LILKDSRNVKDKGRPKSFPEIDSILDVTHQFG
jgi:hypothetical protein